MSFVLWVIASIFAYAMCVKFNNMPVPDNLFLILAILAAGEVISLRR